MNKPLSNLEYLGLYITVFLTGSAVMVIELLGTRLIAPFYGTSLYVWSALISVTMIALAAGYFIGGKWADHAQRTGLSLIIALAAILTLLIPWLARSVLLATDPLGLRGGAFVSALLLFSPSLTMLGMVGPFAIKLATSKLEGLGNSAGTLYAVSTLGSVLGTLVLGFFLFPIIGSREILIGLAIALFLLAIAVAVYEQKRLAIPNAILLSVLFILPALLLLPKVVDAGHSYTGGKDFKIVSERESLYGWVRVIDKPKSDLRILTSDASAIGAASIITGENRLSYQDIVGLFPAMQPGMKRALVIGQGAGHMAALLNKNYGITVDTLEIDPEIANAATSYFGFVPSGQQIIGDARYEIRHLKGPYDLIIHDCFTGGSEPAHLLTVETLTQLRSLLSEQGILALNFVGFAQGEQSHALESVAKTIDQVLPNQAVFISEPGKNFNDFIFLASHHVIDINNPNLKAEQIAWLNERLISVDKTKGQALTDNLNPLEHLQTAKAETYRHLLMELFEPELFVR